MKYKAGDKVRVRKDLEVDKDYGDTYCAVEDMMEYKGKTVTIRTVCTSSYYICEDRGRWNWTDEMFEPVMTNWDKVKEEIKIDDVNGLGTALCRAIHRIKKEDNCSERDCIECKQWLKQPYKEPSILDEKEKKYLSAVIRPFRDRVEHITKETHGSKEFIQIELKNDDAVGLPFFKNGAMYKGMELYKGYTLDELEI